jgi:hypothetical protein
MTRMVHLLTLVAGLVMLLTSTPSWGQTPTCHYPSCNPTTSDPYFNTAGGTFALFNVVAGYSEGYENTAFGDSALQQTTTGSANTAIGALALYGNTTGGYNTASGDQALRDNTTGNVNTASGAYALLENRTGSFNTASGVLALSSNTTGSENTAVGFGALDNNSSGERNTAIGTNALNQSTGNKNIAIGFNAGLTLTIGNNNIFIGNQGVGDESQTIRVGTAQTSTFIAGIANAAVGNAATVIIDTTTGQLGIPLSSARNKQNIETMASRSEGLLKLRPVTFTYTDDTATAPHYGLIAEEVATVYPELVTRTASGDVQTVKYHELIPMLLNELQHEHQAHQQESAKVAALEAKLAALETLVAARLGQTVAQDGAAESTRP